jgi:hypothetical protein
MELLLAAAIFPRKGIFELLLLDGIFAFGVEKIVRY